MTFKFTAGRATVNKGMTSFLRSCHVSADSPAFAMPALRERVVVGACARPRGETRDVADHFRDGGGLLLEVAWPEDSKGRPRPGLGELRYPIAYANDGPASRSGLGASYSAPFVSDVERHGFAEGGSEWNRMLVEACDALLVAGIKAIAIPRGGPRAMDLLIPSSGRAGPRLGGLAAACLRIQAVPLEKIGNTRPAKGGPAARWTACLAPCFTARPGHLAPELALVAPRGLSALAACTKPEIVAILIASGGGAPGPRCLEFNETDVLARLLPPVKAMRFAWASQGERVAALSSPKTARLHLDALAKAIEYGKAPRSDLAGAKAELPDTRRALRPASTLRRGAILPGGLGDLNTPPLLHPDIADHRILRLAGWRLEAFRFDDLLKSLSAAPLQPGTAADLFKWIASHPGAVPKASWPALRSLPIWPAGGSGMSGPFSAFRKPGNAAVARILGPTLLAPGLAVENLASELRGRRLSVPIRTRPSKPEVEAWIHRSLAGLPTDVGLGPEGRERFRAFETELATLVRDPALAEFSKELGNLVPCLSRSGQLTALDRVVGPFLGVALGLLPEHVLAECRPGLEAAFPVAGRPAPETIRAALGADPDNGACLLPRLKAIAACLDRPADLGVSQIPCIPVPGRGFEPPSALAFKGKGGDFWGEWRRVLSGSGLAQGDQAVLKSAGVLSAEPNPATSRAFSEWVAALPERLDRHLPQIIRHFAHKGSVASWWAASPNV